MDVFVPELDAHAAADAHAGALHGGPWPSPPGLLALGEGAPYAHAEPPHAPMGSLWSAQLVRCGAAWRVARAGRPCGASRRAPSGACVRENFCASHAGVWGHERARGATAARAPRGALTRPAAAAAAQENELSAHAHALAAAAGMPMAGEDGGGAGGHAPLGAAGGEEAPRQPNRRKRTFRPGTQVRCQMPGCTVVMSPGENGVRSSNLRYRCGCVRAAARRCAALRGARARVAPARARAGRGVACAGRARRRRRAQGAACERAACGGAGR
jgi:hypothetical protein